MTKQPGAIIALICKMALMTVVEEKLGIRWGDVKRKGGRRYQLRGSTDF